MAVLRNVAITVLYSALSTFTGRSPLHALWTSLQNWRIKNGCPPKGRRKNNFRFSSHRFDGVVPFGQGAVGCDT